MLVSNAFVTGWPASPAYVTKYSGGCLKDESSGMGGFCLLETSTTDFSNNALSIYTLSGSDQILAANASRSMEIYRLAAADFTTFENAWSGQATIDGVVGQDGRCYQASIASKKVSSGTNYFELPVCTLSGNEHTC